VSTGAGTLGPAGSNDQYTTAIFQNDVGTLDVRAKVFNSTSSQVTFDLEVREGEVGGVTYQSGPVLTADTPINGSDGTYQFTPSGSAATITLTDLTAGTQIIVYDHTNTQVAATSGDLETDFSNELVISSGLAPGEVHTIELKAKNFALASFGTIEVTEPSR